MSQDTMASLIERAIEFECRARDLYITFSDIFSHNDKVSTFWGQFSEDESRHMNLLEETRNTLSQEELSSPVGKKESASVRKVQHLLNTVTTVCIQNLNDAYELADEIENSEINAIFRFVLIKSVTAKERDMLIHAQIEEHLNRLITFGQEFPELRRKCICIKDIPRT